MLAQGSGRNRGASTRGSDPLSTSTTGRRNARLNFTPALPSASIGATDFNAGISRHPSQPPLVLAIRFYDCCTVSPLGRRRCQPPCCKLSIQLQASFPVYRATPWTPLRPLRTASVPLPLTARTAVECAPASNHSFASRNNFSASSNRSLTAFSISSRSGMPRPSRNPLMYASL